MVLQRKWKVRCSKAFEFIQKRIDFKKVFLYILNAYEFFCHMTACPFVTPSTRNFDQINFSSKKICQISVRLVNRDRLLSGENL